MKQKLLTVFFFLAFLLFSLLPIVPIMSAAVIPMPLYHFDWVSLAKMLCPLIVGVSYKAQWYTWVVALLEIGVSAAGARILVKRLCRK